MTYDIWIGIDPSVNHTGWAVLSGPSSPQILASGVQKFNSRQGDARYGWIAEQLWESAAPYVGDGHFGPAIAITEKATYQDSQAGIVLARAKNLPTLCSACAVCLSTCYLMGCDVAYVTAGSWKMKTEKALIQSQIERLFPEKAGNWEREDEWEAIGLALWGMMRHGQGVYEIYKHERG